MDFRIVNMDDDELQAIRARRLAELQGQQVNIEQAERCLIERPHLTAPCAAVRELLADHRPGMRQRQAIRRMSNKRGNVSTLQTII